MPTCLKSEFLLDPDVVFLNHGSLGACPRAVFAAYQHYQRELERQPLLFSRRLPDLLADSRSKLARYLNVPTDDVVYFTNPTSALNAVIRSLRLKPGDEILATDHEYGAIDRAWRFVCQKTGATYLHQPLPLPVTCHADVAEAFWAGVTERTRVVFLSHITSPTALTFPVQEICRRARQAGILSVIDGAHAPGHIPLDLSTLGADFYAGSCHKWLCAPKGSAFLYARQEVQPLLEPLIVSWGWESDNPGPSPFIDHHQMQGTRDPAAFLAVPAAIAFQEEHDWPSMRRRCHRLASETRTRLNALTGLETICPDSEQWFSQMVAVRLPDVDVNTLKQRLYDEYKIEVVALRWNDQPLLRVSFQGYNGEQDADALVDALRQLLARQ